MLTKFLNNYGYMILGGAMIIGFSAFKGAEAYAGKSLAPVTVVFDGNPTNPGEVADESNWKISSGSPSCEGDNLACSMEVETTDLTSSGELDPLKIQLSEFFTGSGYIPQRSGGNSETEVQIHNRD